MGRTLETNLTGEMQNMERHKAYLQFVLKAIPFTAITTPDGDVLDGDDERKLEILQNLFIAHPDLFPTPQNDEKARKMLVTSNKIVENDATGHILEAKIISSHFYVQGKNYFNIDDEVATEHGKNYNLYCNELCINIELVLDSQYNDLDEEDQDEIHTSIRFGAVGYRLCIDGYTLSPYIAGEDPVYYLGDTPESLGKNAFPHCIVVS
jgi:hypothetical protein